MRFAAWLVTSVAGLAAAAWIFDGISFAGPRQGMAEVEAKFLPLLLTGVIFGVVNSLVAPAVRLIALPLVILSLGLFLVVINAGMLALTAWIADAVGLGFRVEGFWTAVGGALVITLVTWIVEPFFAREAPRSGQVAR